MIDYAAILARRYAQHEWAVSGDDYEGLVWLSDSQKPSKKTLDDLWPSVQAEVKREQIERTRQAIYQAETDPLFFMWQRGEATEQEWLDAIAKVKQDHPYPQE